MWSCALSPWSIEILICREFLTPHRKRSSIARRSWLKGRPIPVTADSTTPPPPDFHAVRADFPRATTAAYLDNASCHPLSVHVAAALHRYVDWATHEVGDPWWPAWAETRDESKRLFAELINAKPAEIAFARSAVEAESNLLNGMGDHLAGGNIATNDLHYNAALYNYKMRQRDGLDVRIVRNRDWQIDLQDMARVVDARAS
mgnify:CR=1 FL=1